MSPPDDDLEIGLTIGGCRIEGLLGRGGMGTVYRAHHLALDKTVAVKILAAPLESDPRFVDRFVREARAAAKISHANVVHVLNVAEESGHHFIIMQFVDGPSLEQVLSQRRKLDSAEAVRIARDIAAGLEALHGQGIIHRDIKPANILLDKDGGVRITDFGLARNLNLKSGQTMSGTFMGTPEYIAPEQVNGPAVDARADLYSLGVTLYLMVSGNLPFEAAGPVDMAVQQVTAEPRPLEEQARGIDSRIVEVTKRLLRKDPKDRFQDAGELVSALDAILGTPKPAPPPPEMTPKPRAAPAPPKEEKPVPPPARSPAPPEPARLPAKPARRPAGQPLGTLALFWLLVLGASAALFSAGALGSPYRGTHFWEGLPEPITHDDPGRLLRWGLVAAAGAGYVAALLANRGRIRESLQPGGAVILPLFAGVSVYVAGLFAPLEDSPGPLPLRAFVGAVRSMIHPGALGPLALWGLLAGTVAVASAGAGRFSKFLGALAIVTSTAALSAFAASARGDSMLARVKQDPRTAAMEGGALAAAGVGVLLLLGGSLRRGRRAAGTLAVLAGAVLAAVAGGPPPFDGVLRTVGDHGAPLILGGFLLYWGGWSLHCK